MTIPMEAPRKKTIPSVIGVRTIMDYLQDNRDKVFFDDPEHYADRCVLTDFATDVLGVERATYTADNYIYMEDGRKRRITNALGNLVVDLDVESGFMSSKRSEDIRPMTGQEILDFITNRR